MAAQRHVIQRQTVEVVLAKKEDAWPLQQELSHVLQKRLPPLLDRCLSGLSSPDCLYRIDRLELDLGTLDPNRLADDLLEKVEQSLKQALSGRFVDGESQAAGSKNATQHSHLELFGYFVRHGYLPWWADNSRRQLPEKSCMALLEHEPGSLKSLLSKLIREPRSLQRLAGYFDDAHLIAITALLAGAPKASVTALWTALSAMQSVLLPHKSSKTALWQSLLQVAAAGEPPMSRHAQFFSAVIARWSGSQGLPRLMPAERSPQLTLSRTLAGNEWLPAVESLMSAGVAIAPELAGQNQTLRDNLEYPATELNTGNDNGVHRFELSDEKNVAMAENRRSSMAESSGELPDTGKTVPAAAEEVFEPDRALDEMPGSTDASPSIARNTDSAGYRYKIEAAAIASRYPALRKRRLTVADAGKELCGIGGIGGMAEALSSETGDSLNISLPDEKGQGKLPQTAMDEALLFDASSRANINKAPITPAGRQEEGNEPSRKTAIDVSRVVEESGRTEINKDPVEFDSQSGPADESFGGLNADTTLTPLLHHAKAAAMSRRYAALKQVGGAYAGRAQQVVPRPLDQALLPTGLSPASDFSQQELETGAMAFSETDRIYINNAGLCLLWPFLGTFFERLHLTQDGRFRDPAARRCAVSLLHYLAFAEPEAPEYLLPFNKLLCGIPVNDVFEAEPLTAEQTAACDELLEAVIGNAPILNNMSLDGFRGSFLLRRGSLSAGEGSWLLRVERETYDLVLERFPWSWQWLKLPWMEYPVRVEW